VYRNDSKIATVSQLAYTDSPLTSNVAYTYYIKAFDAAGNRSNASNTLIVTPNQASLGVTVNGQLSTGGVVQPQLDVTAPTAPLNLAATATAVSATVSSVALSWSPSSDNIAVTGYEVYRNGSKIATVTQLAYTDSPLTPNVTYTYYIKSFDAAGNHSISSSQLQVVTNQVFLGVTVSGQISSSIIGY
jgi:chitodextrinase